MYFLAKKIYLIVFNRTYLKTINILYNSTYSYDDPSEKKLKKIYIGKYPPPLGPNNGENCSNDLDQVD